MIAELTCELGVSRKFVYVQTWRANVALDETSPTPANDDEKVLVELRIAQRVVDQMVLALARICRGWYRGVVNS